MSDPRHFMDGYGWAFRALQEAGTAIERAPEPVRGDLRSAHAECAERLRDSMLQASKIEVDI